ncbi:diacylglycerol kinase [Streptomyces uncialis]|uniref:Diacylglycerol kinase n=2 Tax=Streptomyces uncialis TaxID=1048205 RepID=A0A1Q4VCW5_9ACTN|nr:diacylglycerol kinase [Streptomyces uncialis]
MSVSDQLMVLVDPVARRHDGESVRIAKDVLSAGATLKVCLPDSPEEFARALARRGSRRPVVVGDDHALLRAVTLLHRDRELATTVLALVPVGGEVSLAKSLGVPTGAVAAARAVLDGAGRRLDLLVDDSDGVVLGGLRIPCGAPAGVAGGGAPGWVRSCRALVRKVRGAGAAPSVAHGGVSGPLRLRVEVDGVTLVDLDRAVETVSVAPGEGLAEVEVRPVSVGAASRMLKARARTVSVSGTDFRYRSDATSVGPVRRRTWVSHPGGWSLTLPPSLAP